MEERKGKWSWLSSEHKSRKATRGLFPMAEVPQLEADEDNPWLSLKSSPDNAVGLRSEPSLASRNRSSVVEYNTPDGQNGGYPSKGSRPSSVRWLGDESSPYGIVDEDGTLNQLESSAWRRFFGRRKSKGFVAAKRTTAMPRSGEKVREPAPVMSTWLIQSILSVGLVGLVLYASRTQNPIASEIRNLVTAAFAQDYSQEVMPAVKEFLSNHHIPLPVFARANLNGTLHIPLDGHIQADYSAGHPEIWLTGKANAPVYAAGAGTVVKVEHLASGTIVAIDHGAPAGVGWYIGLATASVRVKEYVDVGEIIGRLPKSVQHPVLRFGIVQNGHWQNPHDYIEFGAKSGV